MTVNGVVGRMAILLLSVAGKSISPEGFTLTSLIRVTRNRVKLVPVLNVNSLGHPLAAHCLVTCDYLAISSMWAIAELVDAAEC